MLIKFKTLTLQNFKSHRDLVVNFGEITKITAENSKGKSSTIEAVTWTLYGVNTSGSKMIRKLDPTPTDYEAEETKVSLLLNVEDKDLLLEREIKKGKTNYYINEVPSKAGEFDEIVESLIDKDLFLSLYNPLYFPSMHWEKQRAMLMQYVTAPARKEVLKLLPGTQAENLESLLKKHSLDELESIHRKNKTDKDKKHIAAQSRAKTLREQFDLNAPTAPLESLKVEDAQLLKQIIEIEKVTDSAGDKNREFNSLQSKLLAAQDQVEMSKERWPLLKNEVIEDTCRTCKRPLDEESVETVQADKDKRIAEYRDNHRSLVTLRNELKRQLAGLEYIDVSEQLEKVRELEKERYPIEQELRKYAQLEHLQEQVAQAEKDEKEVLASLNDSIFILDSIKDFRSKEAELQGEKVQALFETLTVKLFKPLRNGENDPFFEIEMDDKSYGNLSLSESIRAGLELRDVLSEQSEIIAPCFVDNAESITKFKQPNGQLIISRVIAGKELTIESEEK